MDHYEQLREAGARVTDRTDDGETLEQALEAVAPDYSDITPAEIAAWVRGE